MHFLVRALDAEHRLHTIELDALDDDDARAQALVRSLLPVSISAGSARSAWRRRRQAKFPLLLFAQELQALLAAGLSVIEALGTLIDKEAEPARRTTFMRLADHLRAGHRLSAALRREPAAFPPLFAGIVEAAENTSDLPAALLRYIDYETRVDAVRHRVASAAIYPAILLVVGGAVSLFLLAYVVPRFASVYQGTGRPLPWASQVLMAWGQFAGAHAWELALGVLVVAAMAAEWARRRWRGGGMLQALAVLPGAAARLEVLALSRLYLTLGMLLEGGIALPSALRLAGAVLDGRRQAALAATRAEVESGEPLSVALERHRLSTVVAQRLLRAGEQSGQLGAMLTRTAAFYDGETTRWIERFTKAFEPVLMAAIGIVIGLIVILLYMPVFDLAGAVP